MFSFLGKAVGPALAGVRRAVTGLRGIGSTAKTTSPIAAATRTSVPVSSTVRGGLRETLTRPRNILRTPELPPATIRVRPANDILDRVSSGITPAKQGLDEVFNLVKSRTPKNSPEVKDVKKLVDAAKKGVISAEEGLQQAAGRTINISDEIANPALDRAIAEAERTAMINKNLRTTGIVGGIATALAPQAYEIATGKEAPQALQTIGGFATALPSAALAARGLGGLATRGRPLVDLGKLALGTLGTFAGANMLRGGGAAAAEEAPVTETPIIPQLETPTAGEEVVDPMQAAIDNINAQAEAQLQAVDAAVGSALDELIAAYGGDAYFQQALAENDQMLAMELAAIEADANAARSQIAANYDGAIAQIEGYTAQAGDVLSQAAAEQQAALETAAGGLQGATVPAGMGAAEAAAAGISGTAVGGAGITGAAMLRTQGAAGASQAAADKARVITSLSDQAATGRLNQADMMSALERGVIDAQQAARIDSANRKSKIREAQNQAKLDVAKIKYETEAQAAQSKAEIEATKLANELALRQTYAQLTPEQRAAFTGRTAAPKAMPSWLTEQGGDLEANVAKAGSPIKITRRDRNELVGFLAAYAMDPQATNSSTSLQYWASVIQSLAKTDPAISRKLEALGLPFTAPQLAAAFSTTK